MSLGVVRNLQPSGDDDDDDDDDDGGDGDDDDGGDGDVIGDGILMLGAPTWGWRSHTEVKVQNQN